jgi:microcystin-dependent protein
MGTPYLSEIRVFSFIFAPKGWSLCDGQVLPINQNQALFALLGTTYGGNGTTNFALPNLQARIPMHFGNGHTLGESQGAVSVTLTLAEMPGHTHSATCSDVAGAKTDAKGGVWARDNNGNAPYSSSGDTAMAPATLKAPGAIGVTGGSQAHPNLAPYTVLNFCIALTGIFPSRN